MRNVLKISAFIIAICLFSAGIVYFSNKEKHECNKVVFLEGELGRDINYIDYIYDGNIARIHYCDRRVEDVPTKRIIRVVTKE